MEKFGKMMIYAEPNAKFVMKEYPLRSVNNDELLVKIDLATICRSDIHSYEGKRPNPTPGLLGHEIVGTIQELGKEIKYDLREEPLHVGDRVTWTEYFSDAHSFNKDILDRPEKGRNLKKYGHLSSDVEPHFLGGFAEFCYVMSGSGILKIPDILTDEEAAPLNCGVATMMSIVDKANIQIGDTVVIQGLGLLGLYGCAIAKAAGAKNVIGVDPVEDRLELARKFGADLALKAGSCSDDELVEQVKRQCNPGGADVVIEVCGVPDVVAFGLKVLRMGGRYILGGLVSPGAWLTIDANEIVKKCLLIEGVHNYHPRHLIRALDFVVANRDRWPFGEIVEKVFKLTELNEAFEAAASRSVLRAGIRPN